LMSTKPNDEQNNDQKQASNYSSDTLTEPLLSLDNRNDNMDSSSSKLNFSLADKKRWFFMTLSFILWVCIFIGRVEIFKVKYTDGIFVIAMEYHERTVDFWELIRDAYDENDQSSPFERGFPGFVVVTFCFVVPTLRMIIHFILELNCTLGKRRFLTLSQRYLYICSGDVPYALYLILGIPLIGPILDVSYNYGLDNDLLVIQGYYLVGTFLFLTWAISNVLLQKEIMKKHNHIIYDI